MTKDIECREGEEAAERFREMIKKVVSVPKSEIDKGLLRVSGPPIEWISGPSIASM